MRRYRCQVLVTLSVVVSHTVLALYVHALDSPVISVETIRVPMRDGVLLATDVYRDLSLPRAPVVLVRTPYNKTERPRPIAERFATAGYVVAVQDCRGRFQSEGVFIPYNSEGQDGFDTIEWIGKQPWCNGRIGMWGSSYVGATQWQAAVELPPGLVTITPTATWGNFYRNLYLGGALRLSLLVRWAAGNSLKPENAVVAGNWDQTLLHLPLSEIDREVGWPIPWLSGMITHPRPDGYWTRLDLTEQIPQLELPMQHIVGYYDFFSRESVGNFVLMQERARDPAIRKQQQLILGPWDHGTIGKSRIGDLDFGPNAALDVAGANLEWFDRFLKQDPAVIARPLTPVRYFSMGDNVWQEADTWPPVGFESTAFYLHSRGHANTRGGDGWLDRSAPTEDELADSFRGDPANPTPACSVTDARPLSDGIFGPVDQRPIEDRPEVLVYTSEPLKEPFKFAGNASAELFVSADTPDADWVVKLIDVAPDGFAHNLAVGILRGSFRESELKPTPLNPGQVYQVTIDLGPVGARLSRGHRLRVDVCPAYFPLFDRNPNTGEGPFSKRTVVATQMLYHQPTRPSRLLLPCRK